jgi:uncharacterized damage-inducible protein DinB
MVGMFILDIPGRHQPDSLASEKEMLDGWLDYHRHTIVAKVRGVDDEALRRAMVPSGTSLLGLLKHLALAEHHWFGRAFAGTCEDGPEASTCPCGLPWPNGPGAWTIAPEETTDHIIEMYLTKCERSRALTTSASLDDRARGPRDKQHFTLRWILTHMIEETARHNGHADILRELIDGETGF